MHLVCDWVRAVRAGYVEGGDSNRRLTVDLMQVLYQSNTNCRISKLPCQSFMDISLDAQKLAVNCSTHRIQPNSAHDRVEYIRIPINDLRMPM